MEDSLKDYQEQETSIFDDLDRKKFKEELKFKLTINDISNSPNKPTFGGTIEFNEQRLLNPGKEYTFGMWERSKSEFYLTIVPTEVIVNSPKQQTLSRKPKIAQDAINEYFDTVNFENSKK